MKILYFAPLAFHDLKQRPQEIAEALSEWHEVWYIEPTISFIGAIKDKALDYHTDRYDISPTLHVLRLDGRFALPIRLQFIDLMHLNTISEKKQLTDLLKTCDVIWVGYEVWERLLPSRITGTLIYDKMDDNDRLSHDSIIRKFLIRSEKRLLKRCNLVFVTARQFLDRFHAIPNVYLIPNGFNYMPPKHKLPYSGKKTFGYVGKISHWFDSESIELLADANPDCDIILVGPCDVSPVQRTNVKYIGAVAKKEVPDWICTFDVCLYPFRQNKLLDTINPVKIYEYLAYNKAVLAINSREIREFKDMIYIYDNWEELVSLSHKELESPFKTELERQTFLNQNSWTCRAEQIDQIITDIKEPGNEKSYVSLRNPSGSDKNVSVGK